MLSDFVLSIPTQDIIDAVDVTSIKRELYHMIPWLNDYCKDRNLLKREFLPVDTVKLIGYFVNVLVDENKDIHDFAGCRVLRVDGHDTIIKFLAYRE